MLCGNATEHGFELMELTMQINNLQVGQLVKSKNTGQHGIITCVDYTDTRDRYPFMDIMFENGETYNGFFLMWLYDEEYNGIDLLDIVVPTNLMMKLTKENISNIIQEVENIYQAQYTKRENNG